jgi:hypothetical protein
MRRIKMLDVVLIACLAWSTMMTACSPSANAEATYTGALLRCVDKSTTIAESKACRSLVDAQFGVDKDGGR